MATTAKQSWFTPVLVLAPVLLLIGWNIGGWTSNTSHTFQGPGFTFEYGGHWTRSALGQGAHPGEAAPDSTDLAGLVDADSSVTRLIQLDDPHVEVRVRSAALPGFSIALDQKAYNTHAFSGYTQTLFEEIVDQPEGTKAYRLQFGFSLATPDGETLHLKGEDRIFVKGTRMVVLTYTAPDALFPTDYSQFEGMVASLAFAQ